MTFKPKESRRLHGGTQDLYEFDNGYGASVVRSQYSYGGPDLFELAVIEWDAKYDQGWGLIYDVPGAPDVVGWLSANDVQERLAQLSKFQGVRGKCEGGYRECRGQGRRVRDPYTHEIYGTSVMQYLCTYCYGERCADI